MKIVLNTKFGKGIKRKTNLARVREVSTDDTLPRKLLEMCPKKDPVNLLELKELSGQMGLGAIFAIDESKRLGLGSFKALGAAYVIAKMAVGESFEKKNSDFFEKAKRKLAGITFATSSAGNHGLSVAAGARLFGAESRIYVSVNVP